jgi:glycosyltransferase involved in cell wall biosynthesis
MLYLSGGEGFGIPAFEAMMCGVPLIYTNYSSHADFCKYGGLPVRVDFIPEMAFGIHRSMADTNHAVEQCMYAYNNRDKFKELGLNGRSFALTKTLDTIVDSWHNMFQEEMNKPLPINSSEKIYSQLV